MPSPEPRVRHVLTAIPEYKKSFALLSGCAEKDIERAVIFVHGLDGSARATWADFLSLIDNQRTASQWWEASDLYFYHYRWDSIFRQVPENAMALWNFAHRIFRAPETLLSTSGNAVRPGFEYKKLVLVGHSEGGLLVRKIILEDASQDGRLEDYEEARHDGQTPEPAPQGLLMAELRLFAPAIAGELLSGMFGILASAPAISHFLGASAARKSLQSASSPVAVGREYTDRYARYLKMPCFRAHILWAGKDRVVTAEKYEKDLACNNRPMHTTHTTVCKPTSKFLLPIGFVEHGVKGGKCG